MSSLAFKGSNGILTAFDKVTLIVFLIDYALRLITADYKLNKDLLSFVVYPVSGMAIIDLLSILPGISILNSGFKLLKIVRLIRMMRIFRVFKAIRYSKNIALIVKVFSKQKESLIAMFWIAVAYVFISVLLIFNVEPESFNNFLDAVYWAAVSLTAFGYGDIYPVSVIGRLVAMISSFFGIAVVAMPAGILTAGIMEELQESSSK